MEGIKRSLVYWGRIMEKFFVIVLFAAVGASIFMVRAEGNFSMFIITLPLIGIIALMAQTTGVNMNVNLPQAISFGATRKESLIGIEVFTHIIVVQIILVMAAAGRYIPNPTGIEIVKLFQVYSILLVYTCGTASSVCAAMIRFGKNAGAWLYMIELVIIAAVITGAVTSNLLGNMEVWLDGFCRWGIVTALLFDTVMIVWFSKEIQKFEVRA